MGLINGGKKLQFPCDTDESDGDSNVFHAAAIRDDHRFKTAASMSRNATVDEYDTLPNGLGLSWTCFPVSGKTCEHPHPLVL